jgi:hypothetical protein
MKVFLGFIILAVATLSGLYLVAFTWSVFEPILTHPIASIIFIALFVLFAVRLFKASQR